MHVPSQGHCGFPSFPVVNWFCLFVDLWVMPFHLEDCSVFGNLVITLIPRPRTTKYGNNSFRYEAARLWNTLPSEVRNMSSFDQFKHYISDWCGVEVFLQLLWISRCAVSCLNSLLPYHIFYLHNLYLFAFYMLLLAFYILIYLIYLCLTVFNLVMFPCIYVVVGFKSFV